MEKKFFTIGLVIVLVLGAGYLGYFFAKMQVLPQTNANPSVLDKFIKSSLTKNINASILGEVASVSGTTLVIEEDGSSLSIEIPENIAIYGQPKEGSNSAEELTLEDLKTGDLINASVLFGDDGEVASLNIMVLLKPVPESPLPIPAE